MTLKEIVEIQTIIKNDGSCKIFSCKNCKLKTKCNSDGVTKNEELLKLAIDCLDYFLKENGIEENSYFYTISFYNYSIRIEKKKYNKQNINKDFPMINEIWKSERWAVDFLKKQFPKFLNEFNKRNILK